MKFNVGNKVKILSSATYVGVEQEDVGKIGVVRYVSRNVDPYSGIRVQMSEVCKARGYVPEWSVGNSMLKLLPAKNQQLLFNFM